ncbi:diguanylate cyclase [uncultured Cocleimonas sp.]|uniref:sensor domain-containing diguanylate cyclase n=1 Tax=uncultured Cocleimonas sp. TaxID=1051587 RepID=UPI00262E4C9A|nr:diguanylate cyclase [uncultured Cocleimonas sp.]
MKEFDFNFKDIVDFANDVIIVTNADQINIPGPEIVYVNQAFTELSGYTAEEVIGKNPRILQSKETDEETKKVIRRGLEQKVPVRVTIRNQCKAGTGYWLDLSIHPLKNPQGVVTHFVAIERDVTEQKDIERKLEVLSRTDPLTGLINRRTFDEILDNELPHFKQSGEVFSLLMLDIDHFKQINDNFGHSVGDTAIKTISLACESNLRLYDKMARIGGEEFCVLLPATKKESALEIAEKIREIVAQTPIRTSNGDILATISIGISEVENTDTNHVNIMQRADENLYKAKKSGRNRVCA